MLLSVPSSRRLIAMLSLLLCVYTAPGGHAQMNAWQYFRADSTGLKVKMKRSLKNYPRLAQQLTAHLEGDSSKVRAIYVWVADNLSYDLNTVKKDLEYTVRSGRGVCWQYSDIFCKLCEQAGIPCKTVKGYAKTTLLDLGKKRTKSRHAWNRVQLNGRWEAVDVTWASGYLDPETKKFKRLVNGHWFLVNDSVFASTHNAANEYASLEPLRVSDSAFIRKPLHIYYEPRPDIIYTSLSDGILSIPADKDSFDILIRTNKNVPADSFYVQTGRNRQLYHIIPERTELNTLRFRIPGNLPGLGRQLGLYFSGDLIIAYKLE
ncbi:MAG: hypothetical protein IBJ09_12830 [Bacteroidia bacterium]|nr:hypothetical protein [Bacteroidia bacterium]